MGCRTFNRGADHIVGNVPGFSTRVAMEPFTLIKVINNNTLAG